MFGLLKPSRKSSSRQQIAIKQVKDSILELPSGKFRIILEVTPVNFELKSEEEQDAVIDTYESFLNSVGYPLQILIRTREIDMDKYLEGVASRLEGEKEDIYRKQIQNYDEFIRSLISNNKILTRHFYIIIPYSSSRKEDFELIKGQLMLAADIVSKGVVRLGMQARLLTSLEVLDLFYSFYSPEQSKVQPLTEQVVQLMHESLVTRADRPSRENGVSIKDLQSLSETQIVAEVKAEAESKPSPALKSASNSKDRKKNPSRPKAGQKPNILKPSRPKSQDWIEDRLLEIFEEEDQDA